MRSIFFLVLAANIFFFVQQYYFVNGATKRDEQYIAQSIEGAGSLGGLLLLSERFGGKVDAEKDFTQVSSLSNQVEGVQKEGAPLCTMIGPYEQLLQAEYAVERLAALGADVHVVPVEIKEGESFWVYLVPEVSEREALNRLHELQRKNIESHIISKGDLTNGISFGRFSQYEDAEALSLKIKNNGYDAQIKIMPKTIQETWVVIGEGFAEKIDDSVWEELIRKQKGLEKRQNYCLGVASH